MCVCMSTCVRMCVPACVHMYVCAPACVHVSCQLVFFLLALPSALNPGDRVTVYFHAIVSRDFGFIPDKHKVFIRGGDGLGQKGWTDACEMYYTK